jgi:uncharacterized protein
MDPPGLTMEDELIETIRSSPWLMRVLAAVRDVGLPDAWVGAGVLRDLVWDSRYGAGFRPNRVHDVDVVFFDPDDLSRAGDDRATARLTARLPTAPWEAKNQAAVHTWYHRKFGGDPVTPLTTIREAVATWPETATAIAIRLTRDNSVEVCAPLGLTDLLNGVWRRNPQRITLTQSRARLTRQAPHARWPHVTVIPPA